MKKILFWALLIVSLTACKNYSTVEAVADTAADTMPVVCNQYDEQGRKTGYWAYEMPSGWHAKENYANGVLDGLAVYESYKQEMRMELNFCNGDECGEFKFSFKGMLDTHITDIAKVDTMINGYLIHYRGYFKEYFDDGATVRREGMGYYADHDDMLAEGYYMIGRWLKYDNPAHFTPDTVVYTVPTLN